MCKLWDSEDSLSLELACTELVKNNNNNTSTANN